MPKCPLAATKDGHVPLCGLHPVDMSAAMGQREHNARAPEFTGNVFLALALTEC